MFTLMFTSFMYFMAVNCVRSAFISRFYPIVQTELPNFKRCFSDNAKKKNNLYETLGLRSTATHNEIKKAYYDLTFKYHPDKNEDCQEAATKFREVREAYEILGNYASRKKYDQGVPITSVKKTIKPTVEHKAQFQEFFDSRDQKSSSSDARSREIKDLGTFDKSRKADENEGHSSSGGVQTLLTIVLGILIFLSSRS